jgi:hypothetical protein
MKIQSTPITFIDQTDSRKLEVYVTSNLPTVQIFNRNSGAHTPDWRDGEKLILSMDVFLDSRIMTAAEYNGTAIKWYKNDVEMTDGSIEDISDDKRKITIKDNILKDNAIITYTCEATYQGIVASSRITFTRVDSGLDGEAGADGTSVKILGTASSVAKVANTNYYTIAYSEGAVVAAALGDSYMYNGDLYVCSVLNGDGNNDYFVNVGKIQGEPGQPAKSIVLTGSSQVFKIAKDGKISPSTVTVTAHTVNLTAEQAKNVKWEYRYNASGVWTAITNGTSTSDGVIALKDNVATISSSKLSESMMSVVFRATFDDAEDALTIYKTFDGTDGEKGDSAPIAFLTNENISFVSEADGTTPSTQIITTRVVAYEGTEKVEPKLGSLTVTQAGLPTGMSIAIDEEATSLADKEIVLTITVQRGVNLGSALSNNGSISIPVVSPVSAPLSLNWSKINAGPEGEPGVGINSVVVDYGTSNSASTKPKDDEWYDEIPEVPEGHYLWIRTIIDYTDPNKEDTVTYAYTKQGEQGRAGSSVTVSSIQYQEGTSGTTAPTGTWSNAVVAVADGRYLWTKTTLSDNKIVYGVAKQGTAGRGILNVSEYYLATTASSGVTTSTAGWTPAIQTIDASKRYLWNYETITYTDTTTSTTTPVIIGVFGSTGATGKGIKSIKEYYLASASSSGVTTSTTGWKDTMQTITSTNKYLWNYELITYTDDSTEALLPVVIGVYGDAGADAYTVLLTNESHVFAGSTSAAIASSATTQVLSYKGATSQSATIVSVNGVAASTASTATGIAGMSFQCSALSGISPTITFTCTTAFVSPSGTIPIVIKVGDISITKMFTYSIAFKGATGGTGPASSSYWLVSSASVVQKTSTGTIAVTPSTLTFTGKSQTGANIPTDYACRWIIAYSTDGTNYTNLYTSTANEASKSITVATTYKTIRARMYLAGGTTTLLDEQIIPIVSDGATGGSGTPASLVDITPSAMYFKSNTGSAGPFEPQYIYLYPRFQNATYSNWQYSRDGGVTWTSVSGANGLTVATYNSVANSLRIDRASTLYTNTVTSISFRCNSTNATVYDTVSIAKIYDVVDLQIGGRNYIKNGEQEFTNDTGVAQAEYLLLPYDLTPIYETYGLDQLYTLSFDLKSKDITNGSQISVYPEPADPPISKYIFPYTVLTVTTDFKRYSITFKPTRSSNANATLSRIAVYGIYNTGNIPVIKNLKLELGNTPTDFTPAPEDLVEEAANVNVMLSNEAHFFEATAGGVPIDTSVTLDVIGYKGSVKSATTVGAISGIPSAGMSATVTNNGTANTKLTIAITSALTSDIADYGILTIPITVNGHTINKIFNWTKAKAGDVGASGSDAVTFQVYSNNGYALSTSVPTLTLQTFAYVGDVEIKAGATYQWYRHNNTDWVAVSGATNDYFNVSRDDVTFSNNYMCKMLFGGAEYVGVVTIEDKNDENKVFASKPYNYFAGDLWIVGTDYTPPSYTVGTILRAEHTNTGYTDSDWVPATKYDDEIEDLRDTVDSYKQYFSVNSTNGLQIGNSSINNDILTIDTVNAANINADSAILESVDIVGRYSGSTMLQAPVINLGKFSLVIESNGSLSIVANT